MVAVLDQYEVEYKETYISGTYDQVVMGKMFYPITLNGIKRYVYGDRGVVYGSMNSHDAPQPGLGPFDLSTSVSYQSQPYYEKAGNCRAAKHTCFDERIYDTLTPNPVSCFKRNGANLFAINSNGAQTPGLGLAYTAIDTNNNAFIMFDNYVPTQNSTSRKNFNPGVDRHWTKSFPFEPRYSGIKREKTQNFSNVKASYFASFLDDSAANFASLPISIKKNNLIVGTVGTFRNSTIRQKKAPLEPGYLLGDNSKIQYWDHLWAVDADTSRKFGTISLGTLCVTGSCSNQDTIKVLFGFGDSNTIFYTGSYLNSNNPTNHAMMGTNNWPEFRKYNLTSGDYSLFSGKYEGVTGSTWCIGPIIRGWKYGLYNGLPDFSSAYFRQGRYGQFRDMLEQRQFTKYFKENNVAALANAVTNLGIGDSPVTVKFLDSDENLTDPVRTQSQNLSFEATSSLPFFDLQQRNRPDVDPLSNLKLINFKVDTFGNTTL